MRLSSFDCRPDVLRFTEGVHPAIMEFLSDISPLITGVSSRNRIFSFTLLLLGGRNIWRKKSVSRAGFTRGGYG